MFEKQPDQNQTEFCSITLYPVADKDPDLVLLGPHPDPNLRGLVCGATSDICSVNILLLPLCSENIFCFDPGNDAWGAELQTKSHSDPCRPGPTCSLSQVLVTPSDLGCCGLMIFISSHALWLVGDL